MKTLPDYLDRNIDILAIGLNPSPNSVRHGYPFATTQNRFWAALNESCLVTKDYPPGIESMQRLLRAEHIGFTDVVKRPTPGVAQLRAEDYRRWAPVLMDKIRRNHPRVLWFQGKITYLKFLRYGLERRSKGVEWGAQQELIAGAGAFVTPNPSPANAAYSLQDITAWIDKLAVYVSRVAE